MHHSSIRVRDLDIARHWYTHALGLTELERGSNVSYLSCDGHAVDLALMAGGTGLESISIGVSDGVALEAAEEQLRNRGFEAVNRSVDVPGVQLLRLTMAASAGEDRRCYNDDDPSQPPRTHGSALPSR